MAAGSARGTRKEIPAQSSQDDGILRLGEDADEPQYGVLFHVADKAYEGIVNPNGQTLLNYINILRKRGGNVAASWLLEKLLRPDAYAVLHDDPKISDADVRKIIDKCTALLLGTRPAAPKAKS